MYVELMFILYVVGFLAPLPANGWKALALRFLICLGIVIGLFYWTSRLDFLLTLVFSIPVICFGAGALSGSATRAVLLGLRWKASTGKGVLVILIGVLALPAARVAAGLYVQWQSRTAYAALPTASTLPTIPACDVFRETGPLIKTVMTRRLSETRPGAMPAQEIQILYPAAYREPFPPSYPQPDEKLPWVDFEMYISDAQPAPIKDENDADGNIIPLEKRRSSILFHFLSRPPIAKTALLLLNITHGKSIELEEMPDIKLANSTYPGLSLVVSPQPNPTYQETKSFVSMHEGFIEELVECSGAGTFPHCSFALDESGIPIQGTFPQTSLSEWSRIRDNIRAFASCSVAAGKKDAG